MNLTETTPSELCSVAAQNSPALPSEDQSNLTISDVMFGKFNGTRSELMDLVSGYVRCSNSRACPGVDLKVTHAVVPSAMANEFTCGYVDESPFKRRSRPIDR
jgi:hypothetical protein